MHHWLVWVSATLLPCLLLLVPVYIDWFDLQSSWQHTNSSVLAECCIVCNNQSQDIDIWARESHACFRAVLWCNDAKQVISRPASYSSGNFLSRLLLVGLMLMWWLTFKNFHVTRVIHLEGIQLGRLSWGWKHTIGSYVFNVCAITILVSNGMFALLLLLSFLCQRVSL